MRTTALRYTLVPAIAVAVVAQAFVLAQPPATLRGEVTDALGGVLPGVTVIVSAGDGRTLATTVTNEVGVYTVPALPAVRVTIQFELDGFEPGRVDVTLEPGATVTVGERLRLAQFTEQVTVVAPAPPAPVPPLEARPRPVPVPVPLAELETICLPAIANGRTESLATIHSHRYEAGRTLYAKGDEVNLDAGVAAGLTVGRNLVVRRQFRPGGPTDLATGEHTAGLVQVVTAQLERATGVIVHVCNDVRQGDYLAQFTPEPVRQPHPPGAADFDDGIRILFGDAGQMLGATHRMLVIDRGGAEGIDVGQRLTLYRPRPETGSRPFVLGEAVVVAVQTYSATIRVERATEAIWYGDMAAPQRPSPLVAPARGGGRRDR